MAAAANAANAASAASVELRVEHGAMVALRLFDLAHAIDLGGVERLWAAQASSGSARGALVTTAPKAVAFDVPPLILSLEPVTISLAGQPRVLQVTARLYDFGVVAIALRLAAQGLSWTEYVSQFNALDVAAAGDAAGNVWHRVLDVLRVRIAASLVKPSPQPTAIQEDYLLAQVYRLSEPLSAAALQERVDLVPLLSGEKRPLSEGARRDLLRYRYSYYEDDLVVLTWDRAFILEPRGDSDVADVIEVANAQLLELRYYDELLDDELPQMYDLVEEASRRSVLLAPRRFAVLARRLYTLVAEVTELTEKVDNALQVTEDVYLARVYTAALEQFRVSNVSAAVNRKLAIIRDTYAALYDEASSTRGGLMEAAIVLLIVLEILLALIRH